MNTDNSILFFSKMHFWQPPSRITTKNFKHRTLPIYCTECLLLLNCKKHNDFFQDLRLWLKCETVVVPISFDSGLLSPSSKFFAKKFLTILRLSITEKIWSAILLRFFFEEFFKRFLTGCVVGGRRRIGDITYVFCHERVRMRGLDFYKSINFLALTPRENVSSFVDRNHTRALRNDEYFHIFLFVSNPPLMR